MQTIYIFVYEKINQNKIMSGSTQYSKRKIFALVPKQLVSWIIPIISALQSTSITSSFLIEAYSDLFLISFFFFSHLKWSQTILCDFFDCKSNRYKNNLPSIPIQFCLVPYAEITVLPRLVRRRTIQLTGFSLNVLNERSYYTRDPSII